MSGQIFSGDYYMKIDRIQARKLIDQLLDALESDNETALHISLRPDILDGPSAFISVLDVRPRGFLPFRIGAAHGALWHAQHNERVLIDSEGKFASF